jgi:hypothetical protein
MITIPEFNSSISSSLVKSIKLSLWLLIKCWPSVTGVSNRVLQTEH